MNLLHRTVCAIPMKACSEDIVPLDDSLPGLLEGRNVQLVGEMRLYLLNVNTWLLREQAMEQHPFLHRGQLVCGFDAGYRFQVSLASRKVKSHDVGRRASTEKLSGGLRFEIWESARGKTKPEPICLRQGGRHLQLMKNLTHGLGRLRGYLLYDLSAKRVLVYPWIWRRLFTRHIFAGYRSLVDDLLGVALFEFQVEELPAELAFRFSW